jgi:hypothetical protein
MRTIRKVEIEQVEFCGYMPKELKQGIIYISEDFELSMHLCLCGCGEMAAMPLDSDGWKLIKETDGKISFTPSVLNMNCPNRSHYIITKNIANFV